MPILFKTTIGENAAFELIGNALAGHGNDYDGYMNVVADEGEQTLTWAPGAHPEQFQAEITEILRATWDISRFWIIYERRDDRQDATANEIRNAAFKLTRGYTSVVVVTLSLLSKHDSASDIELIFVCFQQDFQRRNFRVRYEGKFIPDQP
ncbi:hypothetical protein A6U87_18130 [Rhizobium sp. AC44/96]|uniref:hypothetical protein n=1 Tax=unclassified Rhizobium TaxID=2613769 RepID=UPI00081005CF|nr:MULTISPECIES: hypothetical protein [unclassified Rhizobium]MDM9621519.1 hypothetical protein [Rhizobium sp. S96]OCJ02995.1 hypothetical protein A6U87_18130 [Rhizobium sp. AC44/96]